MKNKFFSRLMVVTMTATLIMGGSMTSLAADATSGDLTGTGSSNGHLEQKAVKVVLPTINAGDTTFNYAVDPERLIATTGKNKSGDVITPNDDNVYFKVSGDAKAYASTSEKLGVTSKSSVDVDVTVKAEVTAGAKDISLANTSGDIATAENPVLYLGLQVGSAEEIIKSTGATKTVTLKGKPGNFKAEHSGDAYQYVVSGDPTDWESTTIGLTGKCNNKEISADTTAPTVKVTWSWVETPTAKAPSIANLTPQAAVGTDLVVPVDLGAGNLAATGIASVAWGGDGNNYLNNGVTFDANAKTLTFAHAQSIDLILGTTGAGLQYTITFNDAASTAKTITLQK